MDEREMSERTALECALTLSRQIFHARGNEKTNRSASTRAHIHSVVALK